MSGFDIQQAVPRYLMADRNGKALAKAIEAAMNYCMEKAQEGLDTILDVEKMPEWRLDEMAWETNCMYDDHADVEVKRNWVRGAQQYWQMHGTAAGIRAYLEAAFGDATVVEWFQNGNDPCKFSVTVTVQYTEENEAWIRKSIEKAKNVRSILDTVEFLGGEVSTTVKARALVSGVEVVDFVRMMNNDEFLVRDLQSMNVGDVQEMTVHDIQKRRG